MHGIIYKVIPYRSASKILYLLTPTGKIALIASGSQKTTNPHRIISQYLTKLTFTEKQNRDFYYLTDPILINDYSDIKADFQMIRHVAIALEAIDKLSFEKSTMKDLYHELDTYLKSQLLEIVTYSFLLKILSYLGTVPNLKGDGRKVKGFNIEQGSLVYEDENISIDLNVKQTILLMELFFKRYSELIAYNHEEIIVIKDIVIKYYLVHHQITFKNM